MLTDNDGGIATFGFSLLQIIPLSPFSYADKAAQWSNNELIQLQVYGNKPIINQAHIHENRGLSGLLIIPSSHLAEQMSRGCTLTSPRGQVHELSRYQKTRLKRSNSALLVLRRENDWG